MPLQMRSSLAITGSLQLPLANDDEWVQHWCKVSEQLSRLVHQTIAAKWNQESHNVWRAYKRLQ